MIKDKAHSISCSYKWMVLELIRVL